MLMKLLAFSAALLASASFAQVRVLVDHVGYEAKGPKQALVEVEGHDAEKSTPQKFTLLDNTTGTSSFI